MFPEASAISKFVNLSNNICEQILAKELHCTCSVTESQEVHFIAVGGLFNIKPYYFAESFHPLLLSKKTGRK